VAENIPPLGQNQTLVVSFFTFLLHILVIYSMVCLRLFFSLIYLSFFHRKKKFFVFFFQFYVTLRLSGWDRGESLIFFFTIWGRHFWGLFRVSFFFVCLIWKLTVYSRGFRKSSRRASPFPTPPFLSPPLSQKGYEGYFCKYTC